MPSISAVDEKTGRKFYLDDPDDLQPGEAVVFLLNLHGGGSVGAWQKAYFPAVDYKDKYRLVVATPSAATKEPVRRWVAEADDEHLRNIVDFVFDKYGRERIRSFWLVGHSQGGMTSNRLLQQDFYKENVDGWLSLSGGRVGQAPYGAQVGPRKPDGSPPDARPRPPMPASSGPACDFSHIFTVGEYEIERLPETSPLAERFGCTARVRRKDIVDDKPGYVWDYQRAGYKVWGMKARPGVAREWVFEKCRDGRLVADVGRVDKGHTEGLEPRVTEELGKLMVSAKGGKAQTAAD